MKLSKLLLLGIIVLALPGMASAQIYESKDAEGVPEFSDTPKAGAEVVDLQKTNVADEPPDIPVAPREEKAPAAAAAPSVVGEPAQEVYQGYNNNNNDENAQHRLDGDGVPGNLRPGVEPHPVEGKPGKHVAPHGGGRAGGKR
jgi:hypothetical protein